MIGAPEIDGRLEAFRKRFILRAADDAERLDALLAGLNDPADPAWSEVRKIAHALSGAGGTFGFPDVSTAAETVENATMAIPPDLAGFRRSCLTLVAVLRGL